MSPYAFEAIQKVDVMRLAALSDPELRLLLPCLVRMALCAPADQSNDWAQDKKQILRLLSGVEAVNSIVALLSVDFHALEQDARKEQQLRYSEESLYLLACHSVTYTFVHRSTVKFVCQHQHDTEYLFMDLFKNIMFIIFHIMGLVES